MLQVMKDYYRFGAEVPKVINPIDPQLLVEVLEACYKHHRRGQLGYLPPRFSRLCNYQEGVLCHVITYDIINMLSHCSD